jgi:4-amino-4-deoxy-L-arabinose transferase-like glycosyltransferase
MGHGPRWWREKEFLLVLLLVGAAYFLRIGHLSMRGEEPRRVQVARELVRSGDWIVPRLQGQLYFSRPPLQNGLIAASCTLLGSWDPWAARLPSVLAILLTTALLYGYTRSFLSPWAALAAALAFPTMGEIFQIGRQAETEAVFIFFLSGSLLVWHWGYLRSWRPLVTWSAAYALMALATLCKGGGQPFVYFLGTVGLYLVLTRDLRYLFRTAHLGGILVGVAVLAAWLVPCGLRIGWEPTYQICMRLTAERFQNWTGGQVARHLAFYPWEVFGCTLPWSLLLLAYFRPAFLRSLGGLRPAALFCSLAFVLAFPTCWLPPGGQSRYLAPLYPCLAVLAGIVVEVVGRPSALPAVRPGWRWYMAAAGVACAGAAAGIVGASLTLGGTRLGHWAEPPAWAAAYAVVLLALGAVAWRCRHGSDVRQVRAGTLALAGCMAVLCVGYLSSTRYRQSVDTAREMARLKQALPPGRPLVSLGPIDDLFAYYYADPIPLRPWPATADTISAGAYFCCQHPGHSLPQLPFDWETVAVVSMDRYRKARPEWVVVVGRRSGRP